MPSGMLTAAAKKGSIAARMSTWVALNAYHLIRKGASAENIPQTANPSENARNEIHKTLGLPAGSAIASTSTTGFSTASFLQTVCNCWSLTVDSPRLRHQPITLRVLLPIVAGEDAPHGASDAATLLGIIRFERIGHSSRRRVTATHAQRR